jgi:hypothetical protein
MSAPLRPAAIGRLYVACRLARVALDPKHELTFETSEKLCAILDAAIEAAQVVGNSASENPGPVDSPQNHMPAGPGSTSNNRG